MSPLMAFGLSIGAGVLAVLIMQVAVYFEKRW